MGLSLQCKTAENRGCLKSKTYLVTKRAITAPVTAHRALPSRLLPEDGTGEGHPLKSPDGLELNPCIDSQCVRVLLAGD